MSRSVSTWTHYVCGVKAKTREEAIAAMLAYYDEHPGKRRKKAADVVEVYRARRGPVGWILWVRKKRRTNGTGTARG